MHVLNWSKIVSVCAAYAEGRGTDFEAPTNARIFFILWLATDKAFLSVAWNAGSGNRYAAPFGQCCA